MPAKPLIDTTVPASALSPEDAVFSYHQRTKHHPNRYAASPGYLDWANQPDPFRRYLGAPETALPFTAETIETPYESLFGPASTPSQLLSIETIGAFFELALGLSAWKSAGGGAWALRCNPSSGNLHPTEGYLVARDVCGIPDGVHHYAPHDHVLEHRHTATPALPDGTFLVGLTSIHWREAWKYGERAFRYCQHDVGHAIASVTFAAAALGWTVQLWPEPGDDDVARILGLDRDDYSGSEREHPDTLLIVQTTGGRLRPDIESLVGSLHGGTWQGTANRLSDDHGEWSAIDDAAKATHKARTTEAAAVPLEAPTLSAASGIPAATLIRQRRSAQAFDGKTGLTAEAFFRFVNRVCAPTGVPFSALAWEPLIHPVFIVHRVAGLTSGIYAAPRSDDAFVRLKHAADKDFAWTAVPGCESLLLLREGDGREAARMVSCHQDIASDGAFTFGMLADYEPTIRDNGAFWYRRLFWESGVLGQVAYLEAEALGVRGTGIGCYFDDLFHGLLGLNGFEFQSVYHFTVGSPVEDTRIATHPPYSHIDDARRTIERKEMLLGE